MSLAFSTVINRELLVGTYPWRLKSNRIRYLSLEPATMLQDL